MKEFVARSIDDLPSIATELLNSLGDCKTILLRGNMGAGKTTFTQTILRAMGIEELEGSPTYSLVNTYESPFFGSVYHFDLYRLNSLEEAYDIGIEDILYEDSICFIEWPDKINSILPEKYITVSITLNDELERTIHWEIRE
jgi:tRNA threonylcarbamoyladenosine biosynthesis protein TsaE